MPNFKSGDTVWHTGRNILATVQPDKLSYREQFYYKVIYFNDDREHYWREDKIIKIESEQQKLELILKSK